MKRWFFGGLVCVSALAQAQSEIDITSGNAFLERAGLFERMSEGREPSNELNLQKIMYFLGSVNGLRQANDALKVMNRHGKTDSSKYVACIPPKATSRQLVKVIKSGMEQSPEDLHLPYALLAQTTLAKTYPCPG
jgi:hypothetical protein